VFWIVLLLVSLLGSDQLFLSLAGAREVTHGMYPQLHNVVEEMQIASSLPVMPRIYIVDDPAPNAFAVGKSTRNSAVCVTAGLLAMCDRDELQGVIAHEIGHITNRDVLYLTVAATMLGAVTIIADTLLRSLRYAPAARYRSSGPRAGKGTVNLWILLAAAVFVVVSPVLSRILYFSISRRREFLADATSARLTRFPDGLASALEKMMLSPERLTTAPKAAAPFYIANPYKQDLHGGMFATHPPLRTRIGILRAMHTGAAFKDYMKAFWEVTRTRKPLIPTSDMQLGRTVKSAAQDRMRTTPPPHRGHRPGRRRHHARHERLPVHHLCMRHEDEGASGIRPGKGPLPAVQQGAQGRRPRPGGSRCDSHSHGPAERWRPTLSGGTRRSPGAGRRTGGTKEAGDLADADMQGLRSRGSGITRVSPIPCHVFRVRERHHLGGRGGRLAGTTWKGEPSLRHSGRWVPHRIRI
jgi:heat shock protein HtpX